ncbi:MULTISPECIES: hypothetical protein [unclassified Streptomyces]|uniref:hypothetical protein n=1 Tax=unclassified Streptomyces TaxID=2593676 RepID=UPI002270225D|nr:MULTISPECIES: hypothetical protein [unclassified Streptomyces]MCY0922005.1 hypothetical protein [Streptomyces sp. H27-G5]MCY0959786.1 hypothetical protein [Streptomyces sp. H27-H5]
MASGVTPFSGVPPPCISKPADPKPSVTGATLAAPVSPRALLGDARLDDMQDFEELAARADVLRRRRPAGWRRRPRELEPCPDPGPHRARTRRRAHRAAIERDPVTERLRQVVSVAIVAGLLTVILLGFR